MNPLQEMLGQFHFLRPYWLLLLPVAGLLAWMVRRRQRQRSAWAGLVDAPLLSVLLESDARLRRAPQTGVLAAAVSVLLAIALAGPAWRQLPQPLLAQRAGLVVVLDLSDGMRAADPAPSRADRAGFKIADLLRERSDGQVGLIAYAGDAFTVAPLTDDAGTLQQLLASLEPDIMPVRGQRLDIALRQAQQLLRDAGFAEGEVLVLSYTASSRDTRVAAELHQAGYTVSVLGLGSDAGAPVPVPGGGFARDAGGEILLARRDDRRLQAVVEAGGGRYARLSADGSDLQALGVTQAASAAARTAQEDSSSLRFVDEGPVLVLLALPLAALLFRRGLVFVVVLAVAFGAASPARAFEWNDLWSRRDQQAWQALQQGDHERALAAAEDPAVRGTAAYRQGDFAAAASEFARADDAEAHYNRGNALARAGDLQQALQAYDRALAQQPQHADAQHNRELVQQALQEQQAQQQQQQESQAQGDGQQPPADGQQGERGEPSEGAEQPSQAPQSGQESSTDSGAAEGKPAQPEQAEGAGEQASDRGDADAQPSDAEAEAQASQAHREAIERALQEQQAESAEGEPAIAAPEPIDPAEAEKQQAAEQWLRTVPDDPGGLLRRKFALEHRRRVLEEQNR